MKVLPNFKIQNKGIISREFLKRDILYFYHAINYVKNLDYGRNSNKENLTTVFMDKKGTCSTKHALLKQLADENDIKNIKLILGIFKMNALNTPMVESTLSKNHLQFIPEAHTYLKYGDKYFDFTKRNSSPTDFVDDLLFETEIQPNEISHCKIVIHRRYLLNWLNENNSVNYSLDELWEVREQCIRALSE